MDIITYSKVSKIGAVVDETIQRERYANLFNKDGSVEENTYFAKNNGSFTSFNYTNSQYIPFEGEGDYSLLYPTDVYGTSSAYIWLFDNEKRPLRSVSVTLDSTVTPNTTGHFSIDSSSAVNVSYIGFSYFKNVASSAMFVKKSSYPNHYIPYGYGGYQFMGTVPVENINGQIPPDGTTFISKIESENLFNKNGSKISGKLIKLADGSLIDYSSCSTQFIPFKGEGTYYCYYPTNQYGKANVKLCLYDEGKTFIRSVTGTLDNPSSSSAQPAKFVISSSDADGVSYIGYTYNNTDENTAMFVKSSTYPSSYIEFFESYVLNSSIEAGDANPLFGKEAVFDGDSICDSSTDTAGKGAYAGRIGTSSKMLVTNYAVHGATITSGIYYQGGSARHWVSGNIDTIYSNHPNADYIIFEGGANDADTIGSILDSQNLPAGYGSWTADDFSGEYDDETFCGAVETIIYKAMAYWPKSKIGFVIVMKMSTGNTRKNYYAYLKTIMDICDKWGVPYCNVWDKCPINPSLVSCWDSTMTSEQNIEAGKMYQDGQHPTPTGYDRMYSMIEAWMKTL